MLLEKTAGFFKETANDAVMEKVAPDGRMIGFSILQASQLQEQSPLSVTLQQ